MTHKYEDVVIEVLGWLDESTPSHRETFKSRTEDELVSYHHSLGRTIRNEFQLWSFKHTPIMENGVDISPEHPDAISQEIITEVWRRVQ